MLNLGKVISLATILVWLAPLNANAASRTEAEALRKIHAINQAEIRAGKLAEEKGVTAMTKTYGGQLVKDHTAADDRVKALAQKENVDLNLADSSELTSERRNASELMEKLSVVKGVEFDRTFSKEMQNGHKDAIEALTTYARDLQGTQTAKLIHDLLPSLQKHATMARDIQQAE